MTLSTAKPSADAVPMSDEALERRAAALVNPVSGLANDYLNVFNELVMLVEQLPSMPDLIDVVVAWRPISYQAYFAKSSLPGRQAALDHYETLSADIRRDFEDVVADLDRCATGSVAAIRLCLRRGGDDQEATLAMLCEKASATMHPLLAKAADLVDHGESRAAEDAQMRADRLLAVRIQALKDIKSFQDRSRS